MRDYIAYDNNWQRYAGYNGGLHDLRFVTSCGKAQSYALDDRQMSKETTVPAKPTNAPKKAVKSPEKAPSPLKKPTKLLPVKPL